MMTPIGERSIHCAMLGAFVMGMTACADENAPPTLLTKAAHWGYTGEAGPDRWGDLSPEFELCSTGRNQSPIDIARPVEAETPPIALHYDGATTAVLNNGHTIQVNLGPDSWLDAEGEKWQAVQFHFHNPSEHRLAGESFPLELHIVHRNDAGELAVLGVLLRESAPDTRLDSIWSRLPAQSGDSIALAQRVSELHLAPEDLSYYQYSGSLTTPPCTEGVRWFVLRTPKSVSAEQVSAFTRIVSGNARAPLPLYARKVLQ